MAERGAVPNVPRVRQRALHAVRSLFTPLLPDDYLELINPLWSTQELRGRIERIERETPDAVTVLIRPGYEWMDHRPGQYLRIGVIVDGVIFGEQLRELDSRCTGYGPHIRITGEAGRVAPADLDHLCPDWRERHA